MARRRLLSILLGFLTAAPQLWAEPTVDPHLSALLERSPSDSSIPVVFVLKPQVQFEELYSDAKDLAQPVRRWAVITALRTLAEATQPSLLRELAHLERAGRAQAVRPLWISNAVAARIRASDLMDLVGRHPEVARVIWDPPHLRDQALDGLSGDIGCRNGDQISWGVLDINAPMVWDLGYRGQGVLIASLNTGVDYNHPDLADRIWVNPGEDLNGNGIVDSSDWNGVDDDLNGYVDDLRGWDFVGQNPEVMDFIGMGTATAGIILGEGSGGQQTGIAPEATLMALKALGEQSQFWEAQQYALAMGAEVVASSLSFEWFFNPPPDYAIMRQVVQNELSAGLIHSNSIGNEGEYLTLAPIPFNVSAPGNCPPPWLHPDQTLIGGLSSVIGVGAYDEDHTLLACSSIGPSAWDLDDILELNPEYPYWIQWPTGLDDYPYVGGQEQGLIKPDLAAPCGVLSTGMGGGYAQFGDGTCSAAPHVAGALGLLLSADSSASPEELARVLMSTALDMGEPGKDSLWGCGRMDVFAAVAELLSQTAGSLTGVVADSNTGWPIFEATVELPDLGMQTYTDSLGSYFVPGIPEGSHDVLFTAYGYDSLLVPEVSFSVGVVETLSVSIQGPRIWVEVEAISATLLWGDSLLTPLTIYNMGTSDLTVAFARRGDWEPYELFSQIEAQNATGDDALIGVEVAEGSIWVSGGNAQLEPNKIYRFSFDGELLGELDQPPSISQLGWEDLAWDGQYLYGSSGSDIEGIDLSGNLQVTISGPLCSHQALAYDPESDHFFACGNSTNIVEFGRDGVVVRSWDHELLISGLAWHPQDEDGCPLYIFSQNGDSALLRISKMDPNWGEIIFEADLPGEAGEFAGGATISGELDPDRWCFLGLIQGPSDRVQAHSLGAYAPWLGIEPEGGTIPPGGTLAATVELDAGEVSPGQYDINLVIEHNAPQEEIAIPVSLTVQPVGVNDPPPPFALPTEFAVLPVYPNPFNSETVIPLELPQRSKVKVELFDLMGRNLGTIYEGIKEAGWPKVRYNASKLVSGVYFYRITAEGLETGGEFKDVGKMLLLK